MIDSPRAINPANDLFQHVGTFFGPYCPDMIDLWVMDDVFDAEETAECMPLFPNTLSDGSKIQDPVSHVGERSQEF